MMNSVILNSVHAEVQKTIMKIGTVVLLAVVPSISDIVILRNPMQPNNTAEDNEMIGKSSKYKRLGNSLINYIMRNGVQLYAHIQIQDSCSHDHIYDL